MGVVEVRTMNGISRFIMVKYVLLASENGGGGGNLSRKIPRIIGLLAIDFIECFVNK